MALLSCIIDNLSTMYYSVFYNVWWLCMAINISVQYNDGLLPDIILLTQGYYHRGTCCFCFVLAFCLVSLHGD